VSSEHHPGSDSVKPPKGATFGFEGLFDLFVDVCV